MHQLRDDSRYSGLHRLSPQTRTPACAARPESPASASSKLQELSDRSQWIELRRPHPRTLNPSTPTPGRVAGKRLVIAHTLGLAFWVARPPRWRARRQPRRCTKHLYGQRLQAPGLGVMLRLAGLTRASAYCLSGTLSASQYSRTTGLASVRMLTVTPS